MTDQYQREWIDKQAKKKADEQKLLKVRMAVVQLATAAADCMAFQGRLILR